MLSLLLFLQSSLLTRPVYLQEEPPELRSAQQILLVHTETQNAHPSVTQTREQALAFANELHGRLVAGMDFEQLAGAHSMASSYYTAHMLGTFGPGMLIGPLNDFLFSAELGEFSEPIETRFGILILRRVDTHAAIRHIYVEGTDDEAQKEANAILTKLSNGGDFAELARKHSDEPDSAQRGGDYQVFERGPRDRLLKKLAFELAVGDVQGPINSGAGFHIVQRAPLDAFAPELWEHKWVRARALLVSFKGAIGAKEDMPRDKEMSLILASDIYQRIVDGEKMEDLARWLNDDIDGRERAGDVGWVHRDAPDVPIFMENLFLKPVGWLSEPLETTAGYVILRREQ